MKAAEIRRRTDSDLHEELKRLSQEQFEHRFKAHSEEKPDRGFLKRTRRDVARIHTILRQRALGAVGSAAPAGAAAAPSVAASSKPARKKKD